MKPPQGSIEKLDESVDSDNHLSDNHRLGDCTFPILLQLYRPTGFLPWKIRVDFHGESHLRRSRATQPTVRAACFSVSIIHRTLTWTTGSLESAHMLMHAIAHESARTTSESLH